MTNPADHAARRSARPRVVIEAANWPRREQLRIAFEEAGYAAVTCPGPEGFDQRCPFAGGADCPAVAGAAVVLHLLGHYDPRNQEVLARLQRTLPAVPVVVEVPDPVLARHPERFRGVTVVAAPARAATLIDAARRLLDGPERQ